MAVVQDIETIDQSGGDRRRGRGTHEASRQCAATGTVRPAAELIRFVVGPSGDVVPDVKGKLPGRGIWVTATREAVAEAQKRKAFARGFKREVVVPPDLPDRVETLLERAVLDALAMAGKAGRVATGFDKTAMALERGTAIAVLHATDGAADGRRKLDAIGRRGQSPPVVGFLQSAQMDLALSRTNVVHAALLAGPASETFLARCRRLERFRTGDPPSKAGNAAPT